MLLTPADLSFFAPQSVDTDRPEARLGRFPPRTSVVLAGQLGPLANLRSATGCAVLLACDSPWLELRLVRLRHHQPIPQGVALEVFDQGLWQASESADLREHQGDLSIRLTTGLVPGQMRPCVLWLPSIATCAVAGVVVAEGSTTARIEAQTPRWLALGDSLTQGFSAQSPLATWVHRLRRRWDLPAWNLGVGGIGIEPEAFTWAIERQPWDLITISLGSNHAWSDAAEATVGDRCRQLCEKVGAAAPAVCAWVIPPWKPMEDGLGPAEFMGVSLDPPAARRIGRIREVLRRTLADFPAIAVVEDPLAHDHRLYPDGLHPFALGFRAYAEAMAAVVEPRLLAAGVLPRTAP